MRKLRIVISLVLLSTGVSSLAAAQVAGVDDATTSPAQATSTPEEVSAVRFLLGSIHELPPKSEFERVSQNPKAIVFAIAREDGHIAERAVEALFLWPADDVYRFGAAQLSERRVPEGRKHRLMMLMAKEFGDRAIPTIEPFLRHELRRLRVTAVAALASVASAPAFALVDAAVLAERDPAAAKEMERLSRRVR